MWGRRVTRLLALGVLCFALASESEYPASDPQRGAGRWTCDQPDGATDVGPFRVDGILRWPQECRRWRVNRHGGRYEHDTNIAARRAGPINGGAVAAVRRIPFPASELWWAPVLLSRIPLQPPTERRMSTTENHPRRTVQNL